MTDFGANKLFKWTSGGRKSLWSFNNTGFSLWSCWQCLINWHLLVCTTMKQNVIFVFNSPTSLIKPSKRIWGKYLICFKYIKYEGKTKQLTWLRYLSDKIIRQKGQTTAHRKKLTYYWFSLLACVHIFFV